MARRESGAGKRGRVSAQAEAERQGAFKDLPVLGYLRVCLCVAVDLPMSVP